MTQREDSDQTGNKNRDTPDLEYFSELLAKTLEKWEDLNSQEKQAPQDVDNQSEQGGQPGLQDHLNNLHKLWNISQPESGTTPSSVESESWFQRLQDINLSWNIRDDLAQLGLSDARKTEIEEHYPGYLKQNLGLAPHPLDNLETFESLKENVREKMETLHSTWNTDQVDGEGQVAASERTGAKGSLKKIIAKMVRLHTDPIFQRQRDFNAHTVDLLETTVNSLDEFQHRTVRTLMELTNRQLLFNLALVEFVNAMMQDMLLKGQRNFNAEVVQAFQAVMEKLPALVLERTGILMTQVLAELEQIRNGEH